MGWFGKKKQPETVTYSQTFELTGKNMRPMRSDVVDLIDNRLTALGGTPVMHAIDPGRFPEGPPVWSVVARTNPHFLTVL